MFYQISFQTPNKTKYEPRSRAVQSTQQVSVARKQLTWEIPPLQPALTPASENPTRGTVFRPQCTINISPMVGNEAELLVTKRSLLTFFSTVVYRSRGKGNHFRAFPLEFLLQNTFFVHFSYLHNINCFVTCSHIILVSLFPLLRIVFSFPQNVCNRIV